MFEPARALHENPALFACYILFVYFRGRNAVRIEREMRSLGFSTFHRRNLYPRGRQPGWIAKYSWSADTLVRMSVASTRKERGDSTNSFTAMGDADISVRTPPDFHAWLKRVSPKMTWDWKHQQVIIDQLNKVTAGDCKRLMIFLPPRHGKSELVSVRYTAWRMQRQPELNVILGSYNQRLADRMSRKIRTVICDSFAAETRRRRDMSEPEAAATGQGASYRPANGTRIASADDPPASPSPRLGVSAVQEAENPFPFSRPRPKNAVSEWETAAGGSFRAVGSGSGVTGFGANLIVIDDPVKNRAQAESETFRNRVWDWYKDDLYTRLEPDGSIVLIQTRWHEDDLAGRLLRENLDDWTVINLPALSEAASTAETRRHREMSEVGADETPQPLSVPLAVAGGCTQQIENEGGNASVNERGDAASTNNSPPYEGGVDAALGGRGGSPGTNAQGTIGDEINSTDISPEGRFTPALSSTEDSGGKPAFPTATDEDGTSSPASSSPRLGVSAVNNPFDWRTAPNIALCPERFPIEELERLRTQLGTYSFSALYQQRPTPAGGQIFKREWFKNIIDFAPPGLKWKRGYDLAVSTRTESDYTASFRCAFDKQGNLYISGGFRRRIEFPEQRRYILERMLNEPDTEHGVELALHGQALLQELRRDPAIRGKSLSGVKVSTDKITRALTWSPLAEAGKVILVRSAECGPRNSRSRNSPPYEGGADAALGGRGGSPSCETEISPRVPKQDTSFETPHFALRTPQFQDWISDLLDELAAFPNGTHDDQIDAISIAVQMLAKRKYRAGGFLIT